MRYLRLLKVNVLYIHSNFLKNLESLPHMVKTLRTKTTHAFTEFI